MEEFIMAGLKKSNNDIAKTISQIEDEAIRFLSDVEVAEDGYVHDVPLLAGYVDKDGTLHSTFTYREMTGKDEEAINKADVRANGGKLANVLVERCVSEIGGITKKDVGTVEWGRIIRSMFGGDIDYMAFKIRELSKGNEIEFIHRCPYCGAKLTTIVETNELKVEDFKGAYEIPFTLPRGYRDKKGEIHKEGVMRLTTGLDREVIFPMLKKNTTTGITMLLTRVLTFNDKALITTDSIADMSVRDRDYLENLIKENAFGVDNKFDATCSECGEVIEGAMGQSNFF